MGTIALRTQGSRSYYVYQETYREKLNPSDAGKGRGSGRSRVRTRALYLGSAESILESMQASRKPLSVRVRHFGLLAAAYQTAQRLGLVQLLREHLPGARGGVPCWLYFFVTVLNRLDQATSKNKMRAWLQQTILPELLRLEAAQLTSQNFWYATDDILSERELREQREQRPAQDDRWVGIDDRVFTTIEAELFQRMDALMGLSPRMICYDTTNFYTYIEEPPRSALAATCHSKASKHHLKHVGLLMAVDQEHGLPLVHRVYRANGHDSKVFSAIVAELISQLKALCGEADVVLILDKGNNKKETFQALKGNISWVGSLVPSQYEDLIALPLSAYPGRWQGRQYYRCERQVMGIASVVIILFNAATQRNQEHSLRREIEALKEAIGQKWASYKKAPKGIPAGIRSLQRKSRYGQYLKLSFKHGRLQFEELQPALDQKRKYFGKSIIFSNRTGAETGELIDAYSGKNIIEDDFRLLKDVTLIRFRPIRHWTDTKIRAYAFCCVLAMTLLRVMQWLVEQAGYPMSPTLLKEELTDLHEVVMVYSATEAQRQISHRSAVQNKLWEVFQLGDIEQQLLLH